MSHQSSLFTKAAVLTPQRSGADLSHETVFTAMCGTITPCLVEEVIPNTTISIDTAFTVKLPPLATDFFGRVDVNIEAFFCPYRLCYGGWDEFITQTSFNSDSNPVGVNKKSTIASTYATRVQNTSFNSAYTTPVSATLPTAKTFKVGPGSLCDYLGKKIDTQEHGAIIDNVLPFVAYHKVYEDFYRNSLRQKPVFVNPDGDASSFAAIGHAKHMPYVRRTASTPEMDYNTYLNDGIDLFDLRQRHWDDDYFTTATLTPYQSAAPTSGVLIAAQSYDPSQPQTSQGLSFTIPQLRTANSLQLFLDRQGVTGWKYRDNIYSRFGITPPDLCDTSLYLGRCVTPVYNNSISTTTPQNTWDANGELQINTSGQPWAGVGSSYARPVASDSKKLVDNFVAREHGVVMVMFTLTPHAFYGSGTRRYLSSKFATDFPDALLQNCGVQAVLTKELKRTTDVVTGDEVFGYQKPYSHALYHDDEVHGLLQDGQSLDNFCLKRTFVASDSPVANNQFDTIPKDALDEVCMVDAKISQFGCICDMYHREGIVTPLQSFVIPTLGTPEFMKKNIVRNGGSDIC